MNFFAVRRGATAASLKNRLIVNPTGMIAVADAAVAAAVAVAAADAADKTGRQGGSAFPSFLMDAPVPADA